MNSPWETRWYPASGEEGKKGWLGLPLTAAAVLFGAGVGLKNALYGGGVLRGERVAGVRVISVGNLTVGGAGKTPVVLALAERLRRAGQPVAILSRGYGRIRRGPRRVDPDSRVEDVGDEPLLLARREPDIPVWVGEDRVEIAHRAARDGARVLILDDGMQHRRLARDLDVVVIDAAVGFGNGHMMPRGPLREPMSSLNRAQLVWLHGEAEGLARTWVAPTVLANHRPVSARAPNGAEFSISALKGRRFLALAGLARPERFGRSLRAFGIELLGERYFADHHGYSPGELVTLAAEARALDVEVVTTEKDAVRLPKDFPAWVVRLGVEVTDGEELLARSLLDG